MKQGLGKMGSLFNALTNMMSQMGMVTARSTTHKMMRSEFRKK